jgi:anti-sigma regulatory factor (Ser/Thr protein kinase)
MEYRIQVPAEWQSIDRLMIFADEVERNLPLTNEQRYLARLAIEELATNIMKYSYAGSPGVIQIICAWDEGLFRLVIRDHGPPFDPRATPEPDLGDDITTRSPGGLGLFLVRDMADSLSYHHDTTTGWNELIVLKGTEPDHDRT